jgi:Cu-Zn family superoxide dismutase
MGTKRRAAVLIATAAALSAAGGMAMSGTSEANGVVARARIVDGTGTAIGHVRFQARGGEVVGEVEVQLPADSSHFHGFHVHANDDPANGTGCVGPAFTSADGHWNPGGVGHGNHAGDLPPLLLGPDGHSRATFSVGHIEPGELVGLAVIVHAGPDNLGNVPTRYTSGGIPGPDATTLATGDAGGRFGCGVIRSANR